LRNFKEENAPIKIAEKGSIQINSSTAVIFSKRNGMEKIIASGKNIGFLNCFDNIGIVKTSNNVNIAKILLNRDRDLLKEEKYAPGITLRMENTGMLLADVPIAPTPFPRMLQFRTFMNMV
jgi:hypothetical protein